VILAIDQGTTGTTCIVFGEDGREAGRGYSEHGQHFPRPGWVEHDAAEIWDRTREVGRSALEAAGVEGSDLRAIGITNQRETVVAWDPRSGEPLHNAIVWQDRRTASRCDELREEDGVAEMVRERTGLVIDPYFSATKIEWLRRNADVGGAAFGTIDSWLTFKLTGRHVTDVSNASRTMLFDIGELRWDPELCELFGVDAESLPETAASSEIYGETSEFGGSVPVAGIAGDQQAALFGQACHAPGEAKNTYGTGSFVLLNAGDRPPKATEGLLSTVAWSLGKGGPGREAEEPPLGGGVTYALEASVFVTGAAVQWLRDGLGVISDAAETEELAASLESNDDVYFVPALTGLGSPHWDPYARGTIVGLTRGTGRAHLARAALESIAYQTVDAVRAQEAASGEAIPALKADGGAVQNSWLMQFQADVLGAPVIVPEVAETTALGAAYLAGLAAGVWDLPGIKGMWRERAVYEPEMPADEREALLARWGEAVGRSRGWAGA
jgi:glycerol kinase